MALIPERLAELEGLTHEITSKSGIKIVDTVRFFKGDRPAAEFEAGCLVAVTISVLVVIAIVTAL